MYAIVVALLIVASPDREYDVLRLKNGQDVKGFIVSETEDAVKFRIVTLGRKGETSSGLTTMYQRSEIESIERVSDKARDKAKRRSRAAASRPLDYEVALRKFQPLPVRLMGQKALRVIGNHFVIISTCDDRFVREVAFYLDDVYKAYRRMFGIKQDADRKATVYLLNDPQEYTRFQMAKLGRAIRNPAFYYPQGNFIVAYNLDPVEKANEIRKRILGYERKVQEYKQEANRLKTKMRKDALKVRRKIAAKATRAKNAIRADAHGNKAARIAKVESWRKSQNSSVTAQKRKAEKYLKDYRKRASAYIAKNRGVLAGNYRFRLARNKQMFEFLFHEAFHVFSRTYLWKDGRQSVPRWIEEGLASYYEMSVVEVGELIHGAPNPVYLTVLQNRRGKLLPLEQILKGDPTLFLVTHRSQQDRSNLYYAQSWAIAHYLVDRVPQQRIVAYVKAVAAGANAVMAFELLMGAPIRRLESDIETHLRTLARK